MWQALSSPWRVFKGLLYPQALWSIHQTSNLSCPRGDRYIFLNSFPWYMCKTWITQPRKETTHLFPKRSSGREWRRGRCFLLPTPWEEDRRWHGGCAMLVWCPHHGTSVPTPGCSGLRGCALLLLFLEISHLLKWACIFKKRCVWELMNHIFCQRLQTPIWSTHCWASGALYSSLFLCGL